MLCPCFLVWGEDCRACGPCMGGRLQSMWALYGGKTAEHVGLVWGEDCRACGLCGPVSRGQSAVFLYMVFLPDLCGF